MTQDPHDPTTWPAPGSPEPAPAPADAPSSAPAEGGDPGAYWRRPIDQPGTPPALAPAPPPTAPAPPPPAPEPAPPGLGAEDGDVDFDAWLAEYASRQPHVTMFGERVPIPFDIPLWVQQRLEAGVDHEKDADVVRMMVDACYGTGASERWIARGAGGFALSVVIAWTFLRVQGQKVSFDEAIAEAEKMEARTREQADQTAGLNARLSAAAAQHGPDSPEARAERAAAEAARDAGKAPFAGGGAPSRPTSGVSTASPAPSSAPSAPASSTAWSTT